MKQLPDGLWFYPGLGLKSASFFIECPKCHEKSLCPFFYSYVCCACNHTVSAVCIECGEDVSRQKLRCEKCRTKRTKDIQSWWRKDHAHEIARKNKMKSVEENEELREKAIQDLKKTYSDIFD